MKGAGGGSGGSRAAHLAYVAGAVLIWSTSFVATKAALVEVGPLALGATRFALAALLAGLVAALFGGIRVGAADLGRLCLGGLLGITLYFSLENVGVDLATASDAALVVASYPAIAMVLEALVYRRKLSMRRLSGVALAIVGVNAVLGNALVASDGRASWDASRLLGDAILLATGLVWALYNLATRGVVARYPMPTVVFWQTAFGALFFVPLALVEQSIVGGGRWVPSGGVALLAVAHLGVLCSVVAFLLYARGLKGLDASSAVSVMNLVPVFGVLFAVVLLGEPLGLLQVFGGLVVIAGVTLSVRVDPHEDEEEAARGVGDAGTPPPAADRERGPSIGGGKTWET